MTFQTFVGQKELESVWEQRIIDARLTLSNLPLLCGLVDNFSRINAQEAPENVLFWKCAWAQSDHGRYPDLRFLKEVTELESFLDLGKNRWRLGSLAEKLRENDLEHSLGGLTELTVVGQLAKKHGPTIVEFEPGLTSGKKADAKLVFESRPTYIEVTALNKRESERKLDVIFLKVAKVVSDLLGDEVWVHLEIDTTNLVFEGNKINVNKSVDKIVEFLRQTNLCTIFVDNFGLSFWPSMRGLEQNKTFYDQKLILRTYLDDLYERIEEEPFRTFAKNATPALFVDCPLSSFWCMPSGKCLVEVGDRMSSPSPIASIVRQAFFSHMDRKLTDELNQIEPGAVNIVVVRATDWSISGYETGKLFADYVFDAIENRIKDFLKENSNKHLSAVALYEEDFRKSQFVLNPAAAEASQVSTQFLERLIR